MSALLTKLKDKYINMRGFHTDRQLIVIESDDWGSIRMPSRQTLDYLRGLGDEPEKDGFLRNDSLESEEDLLALFNVLNSISDKYGNHPILTANFAMANPNFEKIDYKNGIYEYEPFYETYNRYYGNNQVLQLIKQGYEDKLLLPQLHCREHLNVARWLRDLQKGVDHTLLAFNCKTMGVGKSFHKENPFGYMDSFNTDCSNAIDLENILRDANRIFFETFGYQSFSFVASCFVWSDALEKTLRKLGIEFIQSGAWQYRPLGKEGKFKLKRILHYTGQMSHYKQIYSVRNCTFEPAYSQNPEYCMKTCFEEIEKAFKNKKPAIINSHRFNYIGTINSTNREENLLGLKKLLTSIIEKYPNVEFVSSVDLFAIMK